MNAESSTKIGINGSTVYTEAGVGDLRVSFFTMLTRDLEQKYIRENVGKMLKSGNPEIVRDLLVMMFQTRDVRGGKGERDLFLYMLSVVVDEHPTWAAELIALIPEYGCWQDMWKLWNLCVGARDAIDTVVKLQFTVDQETERPSLLAKWMPREGSKYHALAKHFATLLFPSQQDLSQRMRQYRRTLALLNRCIDTTEVKMCGRAWATIQPRKVPGRLMKRNKLAFFNQKKALGNVVDRYPDNADRMQCRDNFQYFMEKVSSGEEKMKGAGVVSPHELVMEVKKHYLGSDSEQVTQAQWNAIREEVLKGGGLGKVVPMCDFSGSMSGVPLHVSLALGILISEVATPAFADHILTFDESPQWCSFKGLQSLRSKVESVGGFGQGLNTNFEAAADLILERMKEHNVKPEDAPTDLLVLTDMGFDVAAEYENLAWETHFDRIHRKFSAAGYSPPRIVCWNLRAEYKDFHAMAHQKGVVQLSGWSPAVLKAIQGNGIQVTTPYEGFRSLMDVERYDAVRLVAQKLLS
jgi:hypothetical protein